MPSFTHLLQPTKFFLGFGFGFGLDMEDLNWDTMSSLVEKEHCVWVVASLPSYRIGMES